MAIIGISGRIGSGKDTLASIIQYLTHEYEIHGQIVQTYEEFLNLKYSQDAFNWKIKKFAGKLKQMVSLLTGIPVEDLEKQEVKDSILGEEWNYWEDKTEYGQRWIYEGSRTDIKETKDCKFLVMTVRKLLQLLGTEALRDVIHPNVHINALFADYKPNQPFNYSINNTSEVYNWLIKNYKEEVKEYRRDKGDIWLLSEQIDFANKLKLPNWLITDVRFENEAQSIRDRGGLLIRINRPKKQTTGERLQDIFSGKVDNESHPSETSLDDYKGFDYIIDNDSDIPSLVEKVKQILIEEKII